MEQLETSSREGSFSHLTHELATLRSRMHYAEYPGAILCGVNGVVVKCHGDSSPETFIHGIKGALRLVQHSFLEKIQSPTDLDQAKEKKQDMQDRKRQDRQDKVLTMTIYS